MLRLPQSLRAEKGRGIRQAQINVYTIGFVKNGLLTDHAPAHMKRLVCTDIGIRLTREENKICDETQWHVLCASNGIPVEQGKAELGGTVYYRCPEWLDMTVIKAFSQ